MTPITQIKNKDLGGNNGRGDTPYTHLHGVTYIHAGGKPKPNSIQHDVPHLFIDTKKSKLSCITVPGRQCQPWLALARSFSCPVSGSSRESLRAWDITKHQTCDPEDCGFETGIWSINAEKQTLETKKDCKYAHFVTK